VCPITKDVKYIGKTKQNLKRRLSMHIRQKSRCKKSLWIKSLIDSGLSPDIVLIEICNNKNWKQCEIYQISIYNELLNENKGGGGGSHQVNNYIEIYKENLSARKGISARKNYTSVVSKFLRHFNSEFLNPIWINTKMIDKYLSSISNRNTRNATIIALKDFYLNIVKQNKKLKNVKYGYR
jgi:hypothetical protein